MENQNNEAMKLAKLLANGKPIITKVINFSNDDVLIYLANYKEFVKKSKEIIIMVNG